VKAKFSHRPALISPVIEPFQEFLHAEFASGILLLAGSAIALMWANSPWSSSYQAVWDTPLSVVIGDLALSKPLSSWINDGLMAMFFFVVGLEIKREFLAGELASLKQAALPMAAALGGTALPALIYLGVNWSSEGRAGWGIPMATDIAFSLASCR
jgi:NhaA family Na+:H+ antiporter